jgi:tetratricopeptide (TPR) repeat protein
LSAAGCSDNKEKFADAIDSGQVALGGQRYDVAQFEADEALRIKPSAEAHYIRGRAEEERPKPDADIAASDLNRARTDYQAAIDLHPDPVLEARCRVGLANVAFAQGDYTTAVAQWTAAFDGLDQPEWRAMDLYRIGEAQQRLGQFDAADKSFARVRNEYADQDVAARAEARQGITGFYVQAGSYSALADAQNAVADAKTTGVDCRIVSDQGLYAVRTANLSNYALAKQILASLLPQFPRASIGP